MDAESGAKDKIQSYVDELREDLCKVEAMSHDMSEANTNVDGAQALGRCAGAGSDINPLILISVCFVL